MQVFGLPRHVTRGAALKRWHRARDNGLSAADAAAAVGVSRATLYRWQKLHDQGRLAPRSRRPRRVRRPEWSPELATAVHEMRADFPMWGKAKLTILLRRQGYTASQSTVGRILKNLVERTDTSSATTAPGDTSSTQPGTCPTTTSTTSTDGSTPSPTSSTPSDLTTLSTDIPPPSTFSPSQPRKPRRLICSEPGHRLYAEISM